MRPTRPPPEVSSFFGGPAAFRYHAPYVKRSSQMSSKASQTASLWGNLAGRYDQLQAEPNGQPKKRKLLALDGGGIRGILTLEILHSMEKLLAEATGEGDAFRLGDYFDYIAGTSTGAIIAAGLARGMKVGELLDFYQKAGPLMFDKAAIWKRLQSFYNPSRWPSSCRKPSARTPPSSRSICIACCWWSPATPPPTRPGRSAATRAPNTTTPRAATATSSCRSGS